MVNSNDVVSLTLRSWIEAEAFCDEKIAMGYPFHIDGVSAEEGTVLTVALELPNDMVFAFEARCVRKNPNSFLLVGSNRSLMRQLRGLLDSQSSLHRPQKTIDIEEDITLDGEVGELETTHASLQKLLEDVSKQPMKAMFDDLDGYCEFVANVHPGRYSSIMNPSLKQLCRELLLMANRNLANQANCHSQFLGERQIAKTESPDSVHALLAEVNRKIEKGEFELAGQLAAEGIQRFPAEPVLRACYHYASGQLALSKQQPMVATSQFEAAISFDNSFEPALVALERMRVLRRNS